MIICYDTLFYYSIVFNLTETIRRIQAQSNREFRTEKEKTFDQ
jgi:hypothetical protein